MPHRNIPLVTNEYYHIFNRSINKEPIFKQTRNCQRAIDTIKYYRFSNLSIRLSYFLSLGPERRKEITLSLESGEKLVHIISFCLMPNHFHFLLKQVHEDGISKFISLFQNSYTRYFNTKHTRDGHLFRGQFKAVRIEDDEQLLHVVRYIHLNPYSSFVVKTLKELEDYPYSSLPEYFNSEKGSFCEKEVVLSRFSKINDYKKFIFDQADYQRKLENIKHLVLE